MAGTGTREQCSWCGAAVDPGDGWRAVDPAAGRGAVFCRLEHVVPWHMQGRAWSTAEATGPPDSIDDCAHCGAPLADTTVFLIRHRGEHRVPDGFCSAEHMAEWAKAGGRWA